LLRIFHCGSFSAARSLCDRLALNYLIAEVIWLLVLCAYLVDLVRWQKLLNCHLQPFTVLHYILPTPVAGSMPYRGPHVASPGRHASTSRPYSPRLCRGTPYRVRRGLIHRPRGGPGGGAGIRCCHLCSGLRAGRSIRLRRPPGRLDLRFRRPCPASPRTSAACPPAEAGKRAATHSAANVLALADAARADAHAQSLVEAAFHARPPKPAPLVAPVSGVVLRPATRRYRPRGVNPHRLGARGGGEMTPARRPPLSEPPGATAAWTQTPSSRCPSAPYGGPCPDCVVDGRDPTVTAHRIT